jgi:hypothetical protein
VGEFTSRTALKRHANNQKRFLVLLLRLQEEGLSRQNSSDSAVQTLWVEVDELGCRGHFQRQSYAPKPELAPSELARMSLEDWLRYKTGSQVKLAPSFSAGFRRRRNPICS